MGDAEEGARLHRLRWPEVIYAFTELDEQVLAYATAIRKSQGSEYPAVVIPLIIQYCTLL